MEADLSQLEHLEHHQSVVEEQVVASDDGQVGEELAEALHAVDSEEQQVVCDHHQFGETEASEVLGLGPEHEQDLQVAFDHSAVLKRAQVGHIVPDVLARTNLSISSMTAHLKDASDQNKTQTQSPEPHN